MTMAIRGLTAMSPAALFIIGWTSAASAHHREVVMTATTVRSASVSLSAIMGQIIRRCASAPTAGFLSHRPPQLTRIRGFRTVPIRII